MTTEQPRRIIEAADVDDALIDEAIEAVEGWTPEGERVDWEDIIARLEDETRDFGDSMLSPAILKIQRAVRQHRRENGL